MIYFEQFMDFQSICIDFQSICIDFQSICINFQSIFDNSANCHFWLISLYFCRFFNQVHIRSLSMSSIPYLLVKCPTVNFPGLQIDYYAQSNGVRNLPFVHRVMNRHISEIARPQIINSSERRFLYTE